MKPAPFEYVVANSVSDAIHALQKYGADSCIIAGGQSLLQEMNMRQAKPSYIVDINGITDLDYVRLTSDSLAIGALTRHRTIERSELVASHCPILRKAVEHIAHFQIRSRGTIGGSLVQNAPGAEYGVVARLLDAQMVIAGPQGERIVPASGFFQSHFTTIVKPDEVLTEIRFPLLSSHTGYSFLEVTRRHGHIPIVSAAATLELDEKETVTDVRVALGNVSGEGVPYRVRAVEKLRGLTFNLERVEQLQKDIEAEVNPDLEADKKAAFIKQLSGIQGRRVSELASAEYRKEAAAILSVRALKIAYEQLKGAK
ncbi:xanthine dehydrogenase family protein subunit M [Paenibacillus validus]|uniref:Xanthine dehydrogenase family protein subunit M n=1 Tax=Paenibacillus validus TaxID=44253 RepID=A0A7X2Z7L5_9BACL|nr:MULTISPECIES: xanthine dehydrogenase family protein subunit M [Paenibacillus]MED4600992.1 xanthine dehydrogenase family protein subunit M [Paenibacillus validus]MED4604961.1 xanthine dehydrogenase family protein subunit M [Paenibacillus validus]MUG69768.1 xanthine dehydrogenase family protein subunit M [Paenibacillus validus]